CGRERERENGMSASKCQGKWPDQTLDQAFGVPEVLVAVSTSRLSCKRAGKTRTLMPVWDSSGESRILPLWDETRALIGEREADVALNLIETFMKGRRDGPLAGRARALLDTVVMLRARGRRMAISSVQGVLTAAEFEVERARRDQAVLGLTNEVERMD